MKEQQIKALKVAPLHKPEVVYLDNNLRALQEAVSIDAPYVGLIEVLGLEEGVDLLLNEEGKLIQLQPNRRLGMDILCGVFYVLGVDETRGDFCSLPENMINKYMKIFETPEDIDPSEVANTLGMTFFSI